MKIFNGKTCAFLLLIAALLTWGCVSNTENEKSVSDEGAGAVPVTADGEILNKAKVTVYYFHARQRCVTCIAIQKLTEETIANSFGNNKDVQFVEINISEKVNEAIAEKYEISWSSLVVATPAGHTNLTEEAFAHVMSNPDELKSIIIKEVNNRLTI